MITLVVSVRLNMSVCYHNNSGGQVLDAWTGKHITVVVQNQINSPDQASNSREGTPINKSK